MKLIKLLLPIAAVCILLAVGEPLKPLTPTRLCSDQVAPLVNCPVNFRGMVNITTPGANPYDNSSDLNLESCIAAKCSTAEVFCEKMKVNLMIGCIERERMNSPIFDAAGDEIDLWQWRHLGLEKHPDTKEIILVYCAGVLDEGVGNRKPPMITSSVLVGFERKIVLHKKNMIKPVIKSSQQGLAMNGSVLIATLIVVAGWLKGYNA